MAKKPSQYDILRYGAQIAAAKARMSPKQWNMLTAYAKRHGHTVAGQLSGVPAPLMERTGASLRDEAKRTIGAAYKPINAELSRRDSALGFLSAKRAADDAAYRTWMSGEAGKLDAQARAADATLASQQQSIATDLNTATQAARADSMQRAAQNAGNVSDPAQSTALNQTQAAADTHSAQMVANARTHTADAMKIGADANQISQAALAATAAVREATSTADIWKTKAQIDADRQSAAANKAKDYSGLLHDLKAGEVTKAQSNREAAQANATLGIKADSLAQTIADSNRRYRLENQKFKLDQWTARHANATAQAKIQLGYDHIAATKGQHAADAALRKWVEKYKAKQAMARQNAKGTAKGGVTTDERKLYRQVETVRGLIVRLHQKGTDPSKIRQQLRSQGWDDSMISLAEDLRVHGGVPSSAGRALAKRIGVLHPGYFWASAYETGVNNGSLAGPPAP